MTNFDTDQKIEIEGIEIEKVEAVQKIVRANYQNGRQNSK